MAPDAHREVRVDRSAVGAVSHSVGAVVHWSVTQTRLALFRKHFRKVFFCLLFASVITNIYTNKPEIRFQNWSWIYRVYPEFASSKDRFCGGHLRISRGFRNLFHVCIQSRFAIATGRASPDAGRLTGGISDARIPDKPF